MNKPIERREHMTFAEKIKFICNQRKLKGMPGMFWAGSYQFHPHGIVRDGFLIYDHHNVNNYLSIYISEDPTAEWTIAEDQPTASFDPLPKPIGCKTMHVWSNGLEIKEGPWKEMLLKLVDDLVAEVETRLQKVIEAEEAVKAARILAEKQKNDAVVSNWRQANGE
jgi:hypothetical protein